MGVLLRAQIHSPFQLFILGGKPPEVHGIREQRCLTQHLSGSPGSALAQVSYIPLHTCSPALTHRYMCAHQCIGVNRGHLCEPSAQLPPHQILALFTSRREKSLPPRDVHLPDSSLLQVEDEVHAAQ